MDKKYIPMIYSKTNFALDVKGKILLVEDDAQIRASIRELLEVAGYNVLEAADGEAGWRLAEQEIPDLILLDILIPEMNGFDLLKVLRNTKKTNLIPVITLTGSVDEQSMLKAMELGANDYITKPFEVESILEKLQKMLESRRTIRMRWHLAAGGEVSQQTAA